MAFRMTSVMKQELQLVYRRRRKCDYREQPDGRWVCSRCEHSRHNFAHRVCPSLLLLGDHIARFTRWIGIKRPCGGCKKRQRWLNKKHAAAIELVNGLHAAIRRRMKG